MKIRIQNDDKHGYMTQVTNAETGETIEGIACIEFVLEPKAEPIQAKLTLLSPVIDVIAEASVLSVCPYCGKPKESR